MRTTSIPAALGLMMLAACAPSEFRADVGAMFIEGDGEVALQNAGGSLVLGNEQSRLDEDLGLGDVEASPYLRLQWEHGLHRVRAHGFGVSASGSGRLAGDFGGIPDMSLVSTSMDFIAAGVTYSVAAFRGDDYRVGLGGELGYSFLEVATRSGTGREEVETSVLVPMPFAEAEYRLGPVILSANAGLMSADLGDANGRYVDAEGSVRWQINDDVGLLGGYRYLVLDAYGRASSRDFDADVEFQGWFFGGGVRF